MEPVIILDMLPDYPAAVEDTIDIATAPQRARRRRKNKRLLFDRRKLYYSKAAKLESGGFEGWPPPNTGVEGPFTVPAKNGIINFYGFEPLEITISASHNVMTTIENEDIVTWKTKVVSVSPHNDDIFIFNIVPVVPRKIRVLGLCDGIATGLYCLKKLGFAIDTYFSCEISADAITVQRCRFPGQIISLGCMEAASQPALLDSLGRIDLVLGSTPCTDFTLLNGQRREWHDPTSTAFLTVTFVKIKNYLQERMTRNGLPFYWILEQTAHMSSEAKARLTEEVGCEPVRICASSFSPMYRSRLFFGNTPQLEEIAYRLRGVVCNKTLQDYLEPYRFAKVKFANTLTTNAGTMGFPVTQDGVDSRLTIAEAESLMGFCKNFTACSDLSVKRRLCLMGKAWNCGVILAILRPLREFFTVI